MIGRKLGNRYEVIERIGGGGMAVVYRALDTLLNRHVSIKVLRAQFSTDEEFVRRFRREAQAAASLSHPNVVNIYDVGMENADEYYIVMEYVDGMTLKEVIQERAPLAVAEAIDIAKQICAALGHAHENNIVHRDIKPHNILIGKDGRVKVTDFGIARAITSNTITQDGSVLGSVHYFSPEQARGGVTDVKSDIYSLGVVLYEMVTGELPFSGETPISVALKHLQDHFVEPRQINPALPQSVENIVLKALTKDPLVRYQSARDMYRDLEKALLYPNVPKFTVPTFDEDKTIQMPAVGLRDQDGSMPSRSQRHQDGGASLSQETQIAKPAAQGQAGEPGEPADDKKKNRKFWRPVVWLLVVFMLLGVGAVTAYAIVTNYLSEADVVMPDVRGKTYEEAIKMLDDAGLDTANVKKEEEESDSVAAGVVISQDQYPDKTIKANRPVTLTVSSGTKKLSMPNIEKMTKAEAVKTLEAAGIKVANIKYEEKEDRDAAPGQVLGQNPAADVTIDANTKVTLTIAKGVPKVKLPNLKDYPLDDARKRLLDLGLKIGQTISSADPNVQKGRVIKTSPYEANTEVDKGEVIDLFVSTGPAEQKEEPNGEEPKAEAVKKTANVTIKVAPGEKKVVKIVRTDAVGTNDVINETITETKTYAVTCTVKKDAIASIEIYENGSKTHTETVTYN